jgi:deferrochelatase/peroxidase EfeB
MTDTRKSHFDDRVSVPSSASRRQVLLGLGTAGSAIALGGQPASAEKFSAPKVADAPTGLSSTKVRVPFYGLHQAGIVTPRPAAGIMAACDVVVKTPAELERMFRMLTDRILFLTQGGVPPERDPKLPPSDSGILGPVIAPDNLTITVGLGASLFDNRPWLKPLKTKRLQRMTPFPNDALNAEICHGDLSLQFCSNLQDTNIHAVRDLIKSLSEFLVVRWMQEGDVPIIPPRPGGKAESARNFLGFRDGSANPDSNDEALMREIVWVGDADDEPEWARGGSYQAVRIIRNFVERWDRTPLQEQQNIIGRKKASGAPFGGKTEHDFPDYTSDPSGKATPLDAHIRLANPRTPQSRKNLILRRPFNYSNGVTKAGQFDQGLLFITYQADLEKGFIAVQNNLNGEPLEEYIKPVGGGYFYVLPGAHNATDYLGRTLIKAINADPNTPI